MDNPVRVSRRGDHSQRLTLRILFALWVAPAGHVVGRLATVGAGELGDIGRAGIEAQETAVDLRMGVGSAPGTVMPRVACSVSSMSGLAWRRPTRARTRGTAPVRSAFFCYVAFLVAFLAACWAVTWVANAVLHMPLS